MPRRPSKSESSGVPFPSLEGRGRLTGELELGSIVGVFGVRGEVRVFLHNPKSSLFARPREVVLIDPSGRRHQAVLSVRSGAGKRILGRLQGVDDRDVAASLRDWAIVVHESALPALAQDEFYVYQIEGADVFIGDECVGRVVRVHCTEPVDILEIDGGDEPMFVPCVAEFVASLDGQAGVVRLVPGALEEE